MRLGRLKKMASLVRVWRLSFSSLPRTCTGGVRFWSTPSNGENNKELVKQAEGRSVTEYVNPDDLVQVSSLSGVPEEQLKRVARISMPTRNAMQSGTHNTNHWQLDFDTQERWENPLMGWASSGDPLSNMSLTFDSKEEAIAFAVKSGWGYEVDKPKRTKPVSKSYASNFSWDKNTRVSTK